MSKFVKFISITFFSIIAFTSVLLLIAYLLPNHQLDKLIKHVAYKHDYIISASSPISIERSRFLEIRANDLNIYKNTKTPENFFSYQAKTSQVKIDLWELVKGRLAVKNIRAEDAYIYQPQQLPKREPNNQLQRLQHKLTYLFNNINIEQINIENLNVNLYGKTKIQVDKAFCAELGCQNELSILGKANDLPISISLQTQKHFHTHLQKYLIKAELADSYIQADTTIDTSNEELPIDIDVDANIPLINNWFNAFGNKFPELGPFTGQANIQGYLTQANKGGLSVNDLHIQLNDDDISLESKGFIKSLSRSSELFFETNIQSANLSKVINHWKPLNLSQASLNSNFIVSGHTDRLALEIFEFSASIDDVVINAKGKLHPFMNTLAPKQIADSVKDDSINIDIQADSLDIINHFIPIKNLSMPNFSQVKLSSTLKNTNDGLIIDQINGSIDGSSKAQVNGQISLFDLTKSKLDVDINLDSIQTISPLTPIILPDIGPIVGTSVITFEKGNKTPSMKSINARYDGKHGQIDASGEIGNLFKFKGVDIDFDANINSIKIAELFAPESVDFTLPDLGPIKTSLTMMSQANPIDSTKIDLDLVDVTARINNNVTKAILNGEINHLVSKKADLNLKGSFNSTNFNFLTPFINYHMPDIGDLSTNIYAKGNIIQGYELGFNQGEIIDNLHMTYINGRYNFSKGNHSNISDILLDVSSSVHNISKFAQYFDMNTELSGKAITSFTMKNLKKDGLQFEQLNLSLGKNNHLSGNIDYLFKSGRNNASINGFINVNYLDLNELFPSSPKNAKIKTPYFTDAPLFTSYFRRVNTDLNINIKNLRTKLLHLRNTRSKIVSSNGIVEIGPINTDIAGGKLIASSKANLNIDPPITSLNIKATNFDPQKLLIFKDNDILSKGALANLTMNVSGEGDTVHSFASSLHGETLLEFSDLKIKNAALKFIGYDFAHTLFTTLIPLTKQSQYTEFSCSVINFDIKDGIAKSTQGLAANSKDIAVIGSADINLDNENIDITFGTKAKKGLHLSISQFVNVIKVGGKLYSPQMEVSGESLLKVGARIGAAIYSGGVSILLESFWNNVKSDSDICLLAKNNAEAPIFDTIISNN